METLESLLVPLINPLSSLPSEILLQIIDYLDLPSLASLQRCSKSWHEFFSTERNRIYSQHVPSSSPAPTDIITGPTVEGGWIESVDRLQCDCYDRSYYDNIESWEDLAKRRTLLLRNWRGNTCQDDGDIAYNSLKSQDHLPHIKERILPTPVAHQVWRFRTDFTPSARFILTTFKNGGTKVFSVDDPCDLLWEYRDTRPHAHLEYSDKGIAVWDRWREALEVWKRRDIFMNENGRPHRPTSPRKITRNDAAWSSDYNGTSYDNKVDPDPSNPPVRGSFYRAAILPHDVQLRGFQLRYPHLTVVSSEGKAFIYDLSNTVSPDLEKPYPLHTLNIEPGARGHLDQTTDVVVFSYERKGFHFHCKTSGDLLGILNPRTLLSPTTLPLQNQYHIHHKLPPVTAFPDPLIHRSDESTWAVDLARIAAQTSANRRHPESTSLRRGPIPAARPTAADVTLHDPRAYADFYVWTLDEDEWGAGCLWHNWMVGISRGGRVMICADWRDAIRDANRAKEVTCVIECGNTGENPLSFDLGGWLSVRHGRVAWEVDDRVFILKLPIDITSEKTRPGFLDAECHANTNPVLGHEPDSKSPSVTFDCSSDSVSATPRPKTIHILPSTADAQFPTPISFMSLHEDCIMTTWADVRVDDAAVFQRNPHTRRRNGIGSNADATSSASAVWNNDDDEDDENRHRVATLAESKGIRIVSFLP